MRNVPIVPRLGQEAATCWWLCSFEDIRLGFGCPGEMYKSTSLRQRQATLEC